MYVATIQLSHTTRVNVKAATLQSTRVTKVTSRTTLGRWKKCVRKGAEDKHTA